VGAARRSAPRFIKTMKCKHPHEITKYGLKGSTEGGFLVPCCKCRACRIARSREWWVRLYHENFYWDDSVFATFTYNNEHLPEDGFLSKLEVQSLIRRIRYQNDAPFSHYTTGEYGDEEHRPHYHSILFGISMDDHEIKTYYKKGRPYNVVQNGILKDAWDKGNIILGTVTPYSLRYVTDYIQKKLYGIKASESPFPQPFSLMTKSLGLRWALDNQEQVKKNLNITINGTSVGLPRYYVKKLELKEEVKNKSIINQVIKDTEELKHYGLEGLSTHHASVRNQHDKHLAAKQKTFNKGNI